MNKNKIITSFALIATMAAPVAMAAAENYVSLKGYHGSYMKNQNNGGSGQTVNSNAPVVKSWEGMNLTNLSETEDCIRNGSMITIRSGNGYHWRATSDGRLMVNNLNVTDWEKFQLINHSTSSACITNGDEISLYSPVHGTYVVAEPDGTADADRTRIGSWEKFTLNMTTVYGSDNLDYGLHWVRVQGDVERQVKALDDNGDIIPSIVNYYDDSRPTVIYFHGWQYESSKNNYQRENFTFARNGNAMTHHGWKARGWNVGVFYWNQFADEAEVKDAEAKIWSANGPKGMRYRLNNGLSSTTKSPNKSVGELAFEQITTALANNHKNLRFAGHSLGNQLAVYTAEQINDGINNGTVPANVMPNRIALLDPFWSKDGKSYLGDQNGNGSNDWVGERTRWAISDMIADRDVAVEWYKSSAIYDLWIGDQNTPLESIANLNHLRFWYLDATDIATKHINARHWYFKSMSTDAPEEVTINWLNQRSKTGSDAASARTSDNRIRSMMGDDHEWDQVEGRYTVKTSDDQFEIKNY